MSVMAIGYMLAKTMYAVSASIIVINIIASALTAVQRWTVMRSETN